MASTDKSGRYPLPPSSCWLPAVVGHRALVQIPHGQGVNTRAVPLQPAFVHGVCDVQDLPTPHTQCIRVRWLQEGHIGADIERVSGKFLAFFQGCPQRLVSWSIKHRSPQVGTEQTTVTNKKAKFPTQLRCSGLGLGCRGGKQTEGLYLCPITQRMHKSHQRGKATELQPTPVSDMVA